VVAQRSAPPPQIGIATATPVMLRSLGGALGVALLGESLAQHTARALTAGIGSQAEAATAMAAGMATICALVRGDGAACAGCDARAADGSALARGGRGAGMTKDASTGFCRRRRAPRLTCHPTHGHKESTCALHHPASRAHSSSPAPQATSAASAGRDETPSRRGPPRARNGAPQDERAEGAHRAGAEVIVGDLLDLQSLHRGNRGLRARLLRHVGVGVVS
jgi:hypothetical protein